MREGWLDISSEFAAEMIAERMQKPGLITPTGIQAFDRAMWGFGDRKGLPQGTYAIVGGASNIGKTQFGLWLAKQAANVGQRAGLLSLDMKPRNAMMRLHQAIAGASIPSGDWLPSKWKPEYEQTLKDALRRWRMSRDAGDIAVHVGGGKSLAWVRKMIEDGTSAGGTFFVVDHLQKILVDGMGHDIAGRAEVISDAMSELADGLDVTIVALSQLNRWATRDRDRQPTMQDLWGGTAMESNAEVVILLDHSRYERDEKNHAIGRTFLLLEKSQLGPKAFAAPVEIDHAHLTYREPLDDELDDWPGVES